MHSSVPAACVGSAMLMLHLSLPKLRAPRENFLDMNCRKIGKHAQECKISQIPACIRPQTTDGNLVNLLQAR